MTITTNDTRDEYTSSAGQTVFNYTFKIFENTDLNVYVTPAGQDCDDITDLTTDYVVDPGTIGDEDGGFITLNSPLNAGDLVTIVSNIPASRTTDYQFNGDFTPSTVNNDFDRVVSLVKQVEDRSNRTLLSAECRQGPKPLVLSDPEAGRYLRWRSDERGFENVDLADVSGIIALSDIAFQFDNVAAMKASSLDFLLPGQLIATKGYFSAGDGGGAIYLVSSTQAVDNYGDHLLNNGNVALLQSGELVNIDQYGVDGTNTTDSSARVNAAADACRSSGKGLYGDVKNVIRIDSQINLKEIRKINLLNDFRTDNITTEVAILLGGGSGGGVYDIELGTCSNGTNTITQPAPAIPIVRVAGLKGSKVTIGSCNHFQVYANDANAGEKSVAYNDFYMEGSVRKLSIVGEPGAGPGLSWINENRFYGGRLKEFEMSGDNGHNHNHFFDNQFENADVSIVFNTGHHNYIHRARFENVAANPTVSFSANTYSNCIEISYQGVGDPRNDVRMDFNISDSGSLNRVISPMWGLDKSRVMSFSNDDIVLGDGSGISSTTQGLFNRKSANLTKPIGTFKQAERGVEITGARTLFLSDFIPVKLGDVFKFVVDSDVNCLRPNIFVYDSDRKSILSEGGGGSYITGINYSFNTTYGRYNTSSDIGAPSYATIARDEVAYVRLGWQTGSSGVVHECSIDHYVQAVNRESSLNSGLSKPKNLSLSSSPTTGFCPVGTFVNQDDGLANYTCTFAHETTLDGALIATDTSVTVTDIDSVANADIVGIDLDNGKTHWSTVSALAGSTFTVSAIPSDAADDKRVRFVRWV